jgi:diketogulonate reductase-like aldo/keto reductase
MNSSVPTQRFGYGSQHVSSVGQGTWMIEQAPDQAIKALQRGIDLGLTHIDTAEMYGNGAAERIVAQAIQGRRDQVFLVSKVLPSNAARAATIKACEASLQRLGTDVLDCYLLHWRGAVPLQETFAAFETLQQQGKIRSYGVSNFDVADLEDALAVVGPGKLACNQVLYHLHERAIEQAVIPWCRQHQVAVVAYSPFGHAAFPSQQSHGGHVLASIAAAHAATPQQVALAFLGRVAGVFTIPKALSLQHVAANAAAASLALTPAELAVLEQAFPRGPVPRSLPMI